MSCNDAQSSVRSHDGGVDSSESQGDKFSVKIDWTVIWEVLFQDGVSNC